MIEVINGIIVNFIQRIVNYAPNFFAGLIIILVGLILAGILKRILLTLFTFFKLDSILSRMRLMNKGEVKMWEEVFAEVLRWSVIIVFLTPTLEVWGLTRATALIDQFLLYLPNVIIAVVIGFVGLITSNLVAEIVKHSISTIGATSARTLAMFSRGIIIFFTILIVMNQLGVAQDLVRILFTGIVIMVALAGGLAFGLGGQDTAKEVLDELKKRLK